jgi:hypothetical protein
MLLKAQSLTLVREHSFKFAAGAETHLFLVEELVATLPSWPARFRLRLDASCRSEAKTFYGASCYEVAEKAAEFVALNVSAIGLNKSTCSSQRPPMSPRQILRPLQIQESESD